jgi:hypothetical protein
MDLSIRVIALIPLATCVAYASRHPHLSVVQIVKDHAAPYRSIRQQQKNEIMKTETKFVKHLNINLFLYLLQLLSTSQKQKRPAITKRFV